MFLTLLPAELAPAYTFRALIASIHNHHSRGGEACGALAEQEHPRPVFAISNLGSNRNGFSGSVEPAVTAGTGGP